jgi:hypothetical protein
VLERRDNPGMEISGTSLARSARMYDRPVPSIPAVLVAPAGDPRAPAEDEIPADAETAEEIDKYDISTLACTD